MEAMICMHVEALGEGGSVATLEAVPGLAVQRRTVQETLDIEKDEGCGAAAA